MGVSAGRCRAGVPHRRGRPTVLSSSVNITLQSKTLHHDTCNSPPHRPLPASLPPFSLFSSLLSLTDTTSGDYLRPTHMLGKRARSDTSVTSVTGASPLQRRRSSVSPPAKRRVVCSSPPRNPPTDSSLPKPVEFGCSLPLTQANLSSFDASNPSAQTMSSRPGSPTRRETGAVGMKWERTKVDKYNIKVDTASELPAELLMLVEDTFRRHRTEPPSPNAKHMVGLRRAASMKMRRTQ